MLQIREVQVGHLRRLAAYLQATKCEGELRLAGRSSSLTCSFVFIIVQHLWVNRLSLWPLEQLVQLLNHSISIDHRIVDSKGRPVIFIVHFGEILIHLLVILIIIESLELHLELVLLRSESLKLLHCVLQLLMQVVPLEDHVLQAQLRFDNARRQALVRQVRYVRWHLITARFL